MIGNRQTEVVVGAGGRHPPTRSAVEKPDLDQERFVDILNRLLLLTDGGGDAVQPDRRAAVRHGRAYYKAGRYEEALSHLAQAKEQAGARFWIACSLEKLGRSDEAIVAYEDVMLSPLDTEYAEHAERNRDFLVWKRDFNARITTTTAVIKPGVSE